MVYWLFLSIPFLPSSSPVLFSPLCFLSPPNLSEGTVRARSSSTLARCRYKTYSLTATIFPLSCRVDRSNAVVGKIGFWSKGLCQIGWSGIRVTCRVLLRLFRLWFGSYLSRILIFFGNLEIWILIYLYIDLIISQEEHFALLFCNDRGGMIFVCDCSSYIRWPVDVANFGVIW